MLIQQSSRLLLKMAAQIAKGKKTSSYFAYLNDTDALTTAKCSAKTAEEFNDIGNIAKALAIRAAYNVRETYSIIAESKASKSQIENDLFAPELEKMTRAHLIKVIFDLTYERIQSNQWKDQNIKPLLLIVLRVFALKQLLNDHHDLLVTGYLSKP